MFGCTSIVDLSSPFFVLFFFDLFDGCSRWESTIKSKLVTFALIIKINISSCPIIAAAGTYMYKMKVFKKSDDCLWFFFFFYYIFVFTCAHLLRHDILESRWQEFWLTSRDTSRRASAHHLPSSFSIRSDDKFVSPFKSLSTLKITENGYRSGCPFSFYKTGCNHLQRPADTYTQTQMSLW